MKLTAAALMLSSATAKDLSLTWKDCGGASTKTKITSFSPSSITLGEKTTMTGKGDLSEDVTGASFDLTMSGMLGQLLHCSGDASMSKTCSLPLGTGSLTFDAMKFPIAPGSVPVNVDISLKSTLPASLLKTKTITKATAKNGDDLFCIEINSAAASGEHDGVGEGVTSVSGCIPDGDHCHFGTTCQQCCTSYHRCARVTPPDGGCCGPLVEEQLVGIQSLSALNRTSGASEQIVVVSAASGEHDGVGEGVTSESGCIPDGDHCYYGTYAPATCGQCCNGYGSCGPGGAGGGTGCTCGASAEEQLAGTQSLSAVNKTSGALEQIVVV